MATSILPSGQSHFDHGAPYFSNSPYHDFNQTHTMLTNSPSQFHLSNSPGNALSLSDSQAWPSQITGRRTSSKSPNVSERTPIRHHRTSITRNRSTSGSQALLAYATEQSLQQHQQQHQSLNTPPVFQQTTSISSPSILPPQPFSTMPPQSPFLPHQNYYDDSTSGYNDLSNQAVTQSMPNYYSLARSDLHTSPLATGLSPQEAMYLQHANQPRAQPLPSMTTQSLNFPPLPRSLDSTTGNVEMSSSRNKPQCWDHGCNGRQFSTFSNLLRHQREKSGTAAKARCPHCGTEFTRTTARNGHMYGGKCKGIPDTSKRSSVSDSGENSEG